MKEYDHKEVEAKWQKKWWDWDIDKVGSDPNKPKCYVLDMFPYPSGEGLHVGHPKGYIATDIYSRYQKMRGFNVLHPMGWDAFGLPAENYAIKNKIHPKVAVEKNIAYFKSQLKKIGFNYDWEREINTTDPAYYKWTQWIFLKLWEKGLAYESWEPINWCPSCQTGLANEDLEDGKCERCGSVVEKKPMRQWMLKITDYAERLLKDLDIKLLPNGDLFEVYSNGEFGVVHMNTDQPGTVRPDMPFTERNVVAAFVEHWSEDKFLILKWKKVDWLTPVTGGIESGQTAEEAARAEIFEETGFENLTLVHQTPFQYHSTFFHVPKNENRVGHFTAFHFKLINEKKTDVSKDEQDKHEFVWYKRDEIRDILTAEGSKLGWDLVMTGRPKHEAAPLLNWPESIKESQRNWIGKSEGLLFTAPVKDTNLTIQTFSAHFEAFKADTFVVIAPDHKFLPELVAGLDNEQEILDFAKKLVEKRVSQGYGAEKESEGIFTGRYIVDPVGNGDLPIWVASFALADYGTGIVKCSAHDERDFAFAKKYNIPLKVVLVPEDEELRKKVEAQEICYSNMREGVLLEPSEFAGKKGGEVRAEVIDYCIKNKLAEKKTTYKLKDWVFSRQRYWGEPIPIIHCDKCKVVPVPYDQLPVTLPEVEHYEPTGTGESPLANITDWVNTTCPKCGGPGKRETNTMPQWAGSSWYYIAYTVSEKIKSQNTNSKPSDLIFGASDLNYWLPVDMYVGGTEHATRHLIYARFWHKVLFDLGYVSYSEPFTELKNQGLVLGEDGRKMSKRWGNVVNPDDVIELYGADTLRLYEMFMGPFEQGGVWSTSSMVGMRRFLERVWRLAGKVGDAGELNLELEVLFNQTIKKVTDDIATFQFNTAISSLMILTNKLEELEKIPKNILETVLTLLAPFAPHAMDELWGELGHDTSVHLSTWPKFDEAKLSSNQITISVQINSKTRGTVTAERGAGETQVLELVKNAANFSTWLAPGIERVIYVPDRLINIITRPLA